MSNKVQRALERTTDTKDLLIGAGVVSRTGEMFAKLFPGCKAIIVADLNTWEVAGKAVTLHSLRRVSSRMSRLSSLRRSSMQSGSTLRLSRLALRRLRL